MNAKREYRLGKRAEAAERTRKRIIDAARGLFTEEGFHVVSMDDIASRAEVGRTTVFQQFESKKGLLRAVEHDTGERAGVASMFQALEGLSARESLAVVLERSPQIWNAERDMFERLLGLALIDPDMRRVMDEKEAGRRMIVEAMVHRLGREKALRPGWSTREATDTLALLTGFHAFERLHAAGYAVTAIARLVRKVASAVVVLDEK